MEIFIFHNQKSGEFGPFLKKLNPWNGFKICKKLPGLLSFWVTLHQTTQIYWVKSVTEYQGQSMGQRPSAFFLPFCNVAEVMIIHKMIKENLATKKIINKKEKEKNQASSYIVWYPTGIEYKKNSQFLFFFTIFFLPQKVNLWPIGVHDFY